MKTRYLNPKVYDLYYDDPPSYLWRVIREKVIILVDGGLQTVTIGNVAEYYAYEAGNILSGCRKLGAIVGDWRPVDRMAKECLEIFKRINLEGMRRAGRGWGNSMRSKRTSRGISPATVRRGFTRPTAGESAGT